MLRIILTLFLEVSLSYQQEQKRYCHNDENFYLGQQFIPFSFENGTKFENKLEQDQEILQLIAKVSISNLNDKRELVLKQFQQNQLELIFRDEDHYLCKQIAFVFNLQNNRLTHYEEIIIGQITFQLPLCTKFIRMYEINQQIFIFCEEELYIQLFVLERDKENNSQHLSITSTSIMNKKQNCDYQLQYQSNIYLAIINCQDWIIYVVQNNNFEIFIQSDNLHNKTLKSFSVQEEILLQFEFDIYKIHGQSKRWLYTSQSQQIQSFFSQNKQYVIFFEGENKIELKQGNFDYILLITNEQIPKQVLHLGDKIIINYGAYLQVLERIDASYILHLSIDNLINDLLNYPFFYAFDKNEIILLKKGIPNPTLSCKEMIKSDSIFFIINDLFSPSKVFKFQITNENKFIQNLQINTYLRNSTFSFQLYKPLIAKRYFTSKIYTFDETKLNCQQQQIEEQFNCKDIFISNINWYKIKYYKELYILVQDFNQKLYIKNCNQNLLMELGRFENFEINNVYEIRNQFFIIFSNQSKILVINCQFNSFNLTIIESKIQITNIIQENLEVYLISNTCVKYVLINKQLSLYQFNQYVPLDGTCIKTQFFNDFLGYVHNGVFILRKNYITNIIKFENVSIVNIIKISTLQYPFIIHFKNQDGEYFSKYIFIHSQFIKLYDIPKLNYQYSSPLIYKIYKFFIIVAAYHNLGNHVLLVYYIDTDYLNILIDVIQVDNFNFYMSEEDILIYNFEKQIKMIDIKFDQFICEQSLFPEFTKKIEFSLNLTSSFNESKYQISTAYLNLYNLNKNLSPKRSKAHSLQLEMKESEFPLDPNLYIVGPIDKIVSFDTDLIIIDPIQKLDQLSAQQCQELRNQICINSNRKQLILNPFSTQQILTLALENNYEIKHVIKFQDLIFILQKYQVLQFNILVYNTRDNTYFNFQIPGQCLEFINMQIHLNLYIILCPFHIFFYKIHEDSLEPFSSLKTECNNCIIMEITNSEQAFLYLENRNVVDSISLITFYDDIYHDYLNRTKEQIYKFVTEEYSTYTIQNMTLVNDSYYELLVMKQDIQGFLQYYIAVLDDIDGIVKLKNEYVLIRHFQL
ncbi:unnamed protein product (macronuclear) [Paramecium tetraurelia]|uniref:Transmembrane protein n=1 Tax=Paramecium tetraurelia TaxID=5888 RepID=A0C0X8_PARTE|nr:uncharacterized protein GSPATT00033921001 [Paramecium tetraurelia]CAK64445.1 unnamed protein product [Paramecium tetraurelia]|eukprot:XP_001431843.1 hypothetical protein (macronuclear) [Paramecium tetraurelia strain d4-2]